MSERDATNDSQQTVDAQCDACHWFGSPADCETYQEQESWETAPYTVAICPKCGSEEVAFMQRNDSTEKVQLT